MKRFFIASLVVLVLSVALVAAIELDPGYILISYNTYTLETSVWIGVGLFVLLFSIVYGFFSLLRRLISGTGALSDWLSGRDYRRSQQQTTHGLIAFIEGNWQSSRKTLAKAAAKSETPLLNYLIAARASHALDDSKQMKAFLKKAEQSTSGAGIAVGLTQAELQLRSGRFEQSLATLTRVRRNAGKHPHVLYLLAQTYQGLNDWQQVLALLPELKKYKVLAPDEITELEITASRASILEAAKSRSDALGNLRQLWQSFSTAVKANSEVIACYAESIIALGDMQGAEKLIRNRLKKDWNSALVSLYGKVASDDPARQLLFAEDWLKQRNNDAALFLCLGRLSLRNAFWGKAREYFERSLQFEDSGEVCAEMGRLLAHLGEHEASSEYFYRGLLLATDDLVDFPMPSSRSTS